jgi:hypothetical protein
MAMIANEWQGMPRAILQCPNKIPTKGASKYEATAAISRL